MGTAAARRFARVAAALTVAVVVAGCGGHASTGTISFKPAKSADVAALSFGPFFDADASQCSTPSDFIRGMVSKEILDHYSCRDVMTAAEVANKCKRGLETVGAASDDPSPYKQVSTDPPRQRVTLGWSAQTKCPGEATKTDGGTFEVEVTKVSDGWIVTSFKILTGPGAGSRS